MISTIVQLCVSCSLGVLCLLEGVLSVSCCYFMVTLVSASNRVQCVLFHGVIWSGVFLSSCQDVVQ